MLEKQALLEKRTIHYLEGDTAPTSSKIPILLLHGWGLTSEAFRPSLNLLSQRYRVLAPDLPGFGKSDYPTSSWSYFNYSQSIVSFLRALDIQKIHLIGHSLGGAISIVLASSMPHLVHSLILVDSAGIPLGNFSKLFLERLIELPIQAYTVNFTRYHKLLARAFLTNCIFRTKNTKEALKLPLTIDLRPQLSRIDAPCLVLWGANDRTIPLSAGRELAQGIEGAKMIVVERAYHEWSVLLPQKFAALASDFINNFD